MWLSVSPFQHCSLGGDDCLDYELSADAFTLHFFILQQHLTSAHRRGKGPVAGTLSLDTVDVTVNDQTHGM